MFQAAPVGELKQIERVFACDSEHRTERGIEPRCPEYKTAVLAGRCTQNA